MIDERTTERFWAKVNRCGPVPAHVPEIGECWTWEGGRRGAYGEFWWKGANIGAHVFSHVAFNSLLNKNTPCVLHLCDNKMCVRPSHLRAGTQAENMSDRSAKRRCNAATGDRHGTRTHPELYPAGEDRPNAKFTWEDVRAIREEYALGDVTHAELALRYGASRRTIGKICKMQRYVNRPATASARSHTSGPLP